MKPESSLSAPGSNPDLLHTWANTCVEAPCALTNWASQTDSSILVVWLAALIVCCTRKLFISKTLMYYELQSFVVFGPNLWNSLPTELWTIESVTVFRRKLKHTSSVCNFCHAHLWFRTNLHVINVLNIIIIVIIKRVSTICIHIASATE